MVKEYSGKCGSSQLKYAKIEMTSEPSNYLLFHFEESDVISVLKNSIEYSFVFFKFLVINDYTKEEKGNQQ